MKRTILEDLISVFKSKVFIILIGLVNVSIIARVLGPSLNGVLASIKVYPELFITFGALGIRKSAAFFIGNKSIPENEIYKSILHILGFSTSFSVFVSFLLIYYTMNNRPDLSLVFLALASIPFSLMNTYLSGIFLGQNKIKEFNQINWLPNLFTLLGTVILVYFLKLELVGVLLSQVLAQLLMSIILVSKLSIKNFLTFRINYNITFKLLKLGLAYAIALLLMNLNYRADVVMMDYLSNSTQIGLYSKGSVLTQYLWQIPMLLGTIVFARSASAEDRYQFSLKVCQLLRLSFTVVSIMGLFLALFAPLIIPILFGKEFSDSRYVVYYILPGVVLLTIFKVLNMDISGRGNPLFVLKSMLPALAINLVLNYFFIPAYGAIGASISSTLSYTIGAVLYVYQYSKFTSLTLKQILIFNKADFELIASILKRYKLYR